MAKARKKPAKKRKANPRRKQQQGKDAKLAQIKAYAVLNRYNAGERDFTATVLQGVQLQYMTLDGATFEGSNLRLANFHSSQINDADFREVDARDAIFEEAAIGRSTFNGSNANSANFNYVRGHNAVFDGAELNRATFKTATLTEASFKQAKFKGANFHDAGLAGATFYGGIGEDSSFVGAGITRTNWTYALLHRADFSNADAQSAKFLSAELQESRFVGASAIKANFEGAKMQNFVGDDGVFDGSRFYRTQMTDCNVSQASFKMCGMRGAILSYGFLEGTDFSDAHLHDAFFIGAHCVGTHFANADLGNANFNQAVLKGAVFDGADLKGATFEGVSFWEVDLSTAKNVDPDVYERWQREFRGEPVGEDKLGVKVTPEQRDAAIEDVLTRGLPGSPEDLLPPELRGPAPKEQGDEIMRGFFQPGIKHKLDVWNPKKRKKTPEWKRLINRCHKLWEAYDDHPIKKNLVAFGAHIDAMKASKSVRVKTEAARATRAYNKEFKERGWKKPAKKKASKKSTKKAPKKKAAKRKTKKSTRKRARKNPPVSSVKELKDEIAKGKKVFSRSQLGFAQLQGFKAKGLEFGDSEFSHAQLQNSSWENCTFDYSNFTEADFNHAVINNASFETCTFASAKLEDVVARSADFSEASMVQADLSGSTFQDATFLKASMDRVVGDGSTFFLAKMRGVNLHNAEFQKAQFDRAQMQGAALPTIHCVSCTFEEANLTQSNLTEGDFLKCLFKSTDLTEVTALEADFSGSNFIDANMQDSDFQHSKFRDCTFSMVNLAYVNLTGADFDRAQFDLGGGMDWTNVDLTGAKNVDPAALNEWANATGHARRQVGKIMGQLGMGQPAGGPAPKGWSSVGGGGGRPDEAGDPWSHKGSPGDGWYLTKRQPDEFAGKRRARRTRRYFSTEEEAQAAVSYLNSRFDPSLPYSADFPLAEGLAQGGVPAEVIDDTDAKTRSREDENLRWAMEHEFGTEFDQERAARWADEDVEEDEDSPEWVKRGMSFSEWMKTSNPKKRRRKKASKKKSSKRKAKRKR